MVLFHSENGYNIPNKQLIKNWLKSVCSDNNKILKDINIIFMSDEQLLNINQQYLNHDYYTDVITFDYCTNNTVSGDIYISIDRVKDNSEKFKASFRKELLRVIVHGVLHLLGYADKTDLQKNEMRNFEDKYLGDFLLNDFINEK